ncbi:MAG: PAS domain S-box protein [Ferruginibacter sp.]
MESSGEMSTLIRSMDWSVTFPGPIEYWPHSLQTAISICLNSSLPVLIGWGPERILLYNDAFRIVMGEYHPLALGVAAGKVLLQLNNISGSMVPDILESDKACAGEGTISIERNDKKESSSFTYSLSPLHDEAGNIEGIFCSVNGSLEFTQANENLLKSETNFRHLVLQAPVGICIVKDHPLKVEIVNDAYLNITGRNRGEFESKNYWEVLKEAEEFYSPIVQNAMETGVAHYAKEQAVKLIRNGIEETLYVDFLYQPLKEPGDSIKSLMMVVIDVTDKVLARKKIEGSEREFRQLADTLPQLVWTTDPNGKQLFASRSWEEFTGMDPDGPNTWIKIVHPKDFEKINNLFAESLATGKHYKGEVRLKSKENNYEWHYVLGEPIKNDKGEIEKWAGAFTNINHQKLAEESLVLQAQVLESMDEGVSVSDEMGYILFTNAAEDRMFGYECGELTGKHATIQNAYPQEENIRIVVEVIEAVSTSGSWTGEWYNKKKDGTTFYTQSHISAIEVSGKKLMVCVQRNITEEKVYKEELKRFKFMADNASDPFILMKEDGSFAYLNDLALQRWGYNREEILKLRVPDIDPLYDIDSFKKIFAKAQKEKIPHFETIHKMKDGTEYPVDVNMGGIVLNGIPYLFAVARDITEWKKAREELNLSLERFQHMSDTMAQFVWTADAEGNLNYFNKAVFDYSGFSHKKLQNEGWLQMVHPDDHKENIGKWTHSVETGEHFSLHHRFLRNDGVYRWQLSRAIPQLDSNGKIILWVGTSTDIHDQKLFEEKLAKEVADRTQELSEANQLLQKSNAELEQFAYVASHDLQEPLRKIRTFATMLDNVKNKLSEKENTYLHKIISSSERMSTLINDILIFSKLSQTDVSYEQVKLDEILDKVLEDLEIEIALKHVIIDKDPLPEIEAIPIQMNQLFFNLMSNSLKFSKENIPLEIKIKVLKPSAAELNKYNLNKSLQYIKIVFRDNGIGFDQQYDKKIFNIFQRLNNRSYAGSGIGLALCRKILHTHQGEIFAESVVQEGAAFNILLPVDPGNSKS